MKPTTHLAIAFCVVGFLLFHFSDFVFELLQFVAGSVGISAIQFAAHIGVEAVQVASRIGPIAVHFTTGWIR